MNGETLLHCWCAHSILGYMPSDFLSVKEEKERTHATIKSNTYLTDDDQRMAGKSESPHEIFDGQGKYGSTTKVDSYNVLHAMHLRAP